jgi:predicted ribosome quality control (RQC) complex YloA/Tae2 family protein
MSLNWKEIEAVLNELDLADSHIQQIFQRDYRNIYFQIYKPGNTMILRICLESGKTRLHETRRKPGSKGRQPRFSEFLRARIRGGRIINAEQIGSERIIRVDISRGEEISRMYVKLWSNAANILLCDEHDVILEAAYRRPGRGETAGERFHPPAAGDPPEKARNMELRSWKGFESFQQAIAAEYAEKERDEERSRLKRDLLRYFAMMENSLSGRIKRVEKAKNALGTAEVLQQRGDLILGNIWRIQAGDALLEAEDYGNPGQIITIPLDPSLGPAENADACFSEAKKIRDRAEHLEQEREQIIRQLEDVRNSIQEINKDEIDITRLRELSDEMRQRSSEQRSKKDDKGPPGLEFFSGGYRILVGRNARENDGLLRRHTRGNDTWIHTRDYPGGYVFIKYRSGKSIPLDVLLDAGNLALFFSKAKANGQADMYYTQVKHLRRAKDGPLGLVLPTQEKNLFIKADEKRLKRLLKGELG